MRAGDKLSRARADGLRFILSPTGLKITGPRAAVNQWLPVLKPERDEIIRYLKESNIVPTYREEHWVPGMWARSAPMVDQLRIILRDIYGDNDRIIGGELDAACMNVNALSESLCKWRRIHSEVESMERLWGQINFPGEGAG